MGDPEADFYLQPASLRCYEKGDTPRVSALEPRVTLVGNWEA